MSKYFDQGICDAHVPDLHVQQRMVLDGNIEEIAKYHAAGFNLYYALEYSAALGKHHITQFLIKLEVPVTRFALHNAAQRRGPGIDYLLCALEGEDLRFAQRATASFRMALGDQDKAFSLLEACGEPDRFFLSAAYDGCRLKQLEWKGRFQDVLDRVLPIVDRHTLEASHLEFIVAGGRPVHIERTLEILGRPMAYLLARVMALRGESCAMRLRELGAAIDNEAFAVCAQEVSWEATQRIEDYVHRLCTFSVCDSGPGSIRVASADRLVRLVLQATSEAFNKQYLSASEVNHRFRRIFSRLIPCIVGSEHFQLDEIVIDWNHASPTGLAPEQLAQVRALIEEISAASQAPNSPSVFP